MKNKLPLAIIAGIVGTIAFTLITFIAPLMGMPKMSPAGMLSMMMGVPIAAGWIMHFMIGIIFAVIYVYVFAGLFKKISSPVLKGTIYGVIVFLFAQIIMMLMNGMMTLPAIRASEMAMAAGSLIGHLVFGITVTSLAKEELISSFD